MYLYSVCEQEYMGVCISRGQRKIKTLVSFCSTYMKYKLQSNGKLFQLKIFIYYHSTDIIYSCLQSDHVNYPIELIMEKVQTFLLHCIIYHCHFFNNLNVYQFLKNCFHLFILIQLEYEYILKNKENSFPRFVTYSQRVTTLSFLLFGIVLLIQKLPIQVMIKASKL